MLKRIANILKIIPEKYYVIKFYVVKYCLGKSLSILGWNLNPNLCFEKK